MADELSTEALDYLSSGIKSEIAAYVFYKKFAAKTDSDQLRNTMERFADEERKHFLSLERHYDRYVRSEKWVTYRDTLAKDGLPDIDETIGDKHVRRLGEMERADTNLDVLKIALAFEEEARDLYREAATKSTAQDVKETFEFLAKFEEGHVRFVSELIAAETSETG
jgi:rubrerythrin